MVDWTGEKTKALVLTCFPVCPFCSNQSVKPDSWHNLWNTDYRAKCAFCGAEWHVYVSLLTDQLKWATLTKAGTHGGVDLLGKRQAPGFWREMSLKTTVSKAEPATNEAAEKVMLREIRREVVIKIRCSHCNQAFDETLNNCPNCGASR